VVEDEDEDAMREVTRRILERNGYRWSPPARGSEALDPGLVLLEKPFTEGQLLAKVREVLEAATGRGAEA
jgi:DNA-binding response OmpR family regulator